MNTYSSTLPDSPIFDKLPEHIQINNFVGKPEDDKDDKDSKSIFYDILLLILHYIRYYVMKDSTPYIYYLM